MFFDAPNLRILLRVLILMICLVLPWSTANSAVIDEIASDFKPLAGVVVMASNGEFIIDLDESKGVAIGDIFSVITAGKKIVHPESGKVLGTLEEVKGILKITRIKSGYSFSRPLGQKVDFKRGDSIRRYSNLPALFWDYTGKGRPFFSRLQSTLPELKWQDYETTQRSRPAQPEPIRTNRDTIVFILTNRGIEVRDPEFFVLHSYDQPDLSTPLSSAPAAVREAQPAAKFTPAPTVTPPTKAAPLKIESEPEVNKETIRFKPQFTHAQTIGQISDFSVMTDFVRSENRLLMASTDGIKIVIYDVANHLVPLVEGAPSYPGQILALKWWQPSKDDTLYLAVVSWADASVSGDIFSFDGKNLFPIKERIPRILGTFDLDGDQRPETLLGQRFDGENFFGDSVKELKLIKGKLKSFNCALPLPGRFTVLGSLFVDLTGDGQLETVFIRGNILYIYHKKKRLYQSPKEMGGSLSFLTYYIDPTAKNIMPTSASFEVSPTVADLDGDGRLEILVVASERNIAGVVKAAPGINKSWINVVKFRQGRFVRGSLGEEMDTALQGLMVDGKRVLFVVTTQGDIFGKGRNSHLLAYSLDL